MTTILYIFFTLIAVGFCSGIIFLIYLPFRKRLIKVGRLSKKLDKRINLCFFGFMILIGIVLFCFKDYRTPSKDRLEAISNVKLPSDFKIITDKYQDMWQDYCVIYEIQFDNQASSELIQSIKSSKFYNSKSYHNGAWKNSDLILVDSVKAAWIKSPKGYDFGKPNGRTTYFITFDTLTNKLSYNECHD